MPRTRADGQAAGAIVGLCWSPGMCPRSWRAPGGHLEASLRSLWSNSEGLELTAQAIRSASITGCSRRPHVAELASLVKTRVNSGKHAYEGKTLVNKRSLRRDLPPRKTRGGREAREMMPSAVTPQGAGIPASVKALGTPRLAGREGLGGDPCRRGWEETGPLTAW